MSEEAKRKSFLQKCLDLEADPEDSVKLYREWSNMDAATRPQFCHWIGVSYSEAAIMSEDGYHFRRVFWGYLQSLSRSDPENFPDKYAGGYATGQEWGEAAWETYKRLRYGSADIEVGGLKAKRLLARRDALDDSDEVKPKPDRTKRQLKVKERHTEDFPDAIDYSMGPPWYGHFTIVPQALIEDPELDPTAKMVAIVLIPWFFRGKKEQETAYVYNSTICDTLGIGDTTVTCKIADLVDRGWISVVGTKGRHQRLMTLNWRKPGFKWPYGEPDKEKALRERHKKPRLEGAEIRHP